MPKTAWGKKIKQNVPTHTPGPALAESEASATITTIRLPKRKQFRDFIVP